MCGLEVEIVLLGYNIENSKNIACFVNLYSLFLLKTGSTCSVRDSTVFDNASVQLMAD